MGKHGEVKSGKRRFDLDTVKGWFGLWKGDPPNWQHLKALPEWQPTEWLNDRGLADSLRSSTLGPDEVAKMMERQP